ncbi:hypothetical protein [Maricaulis sp.]|uniref:hypothetical protein n=1 Tax=Maricaulis sp. TaxID=1486257 RepID=UPI00262E517E|nr:hypothetical protein [Maricaulis sp.]
MHLDLTPTLILLALGIGLFVLARWKSAQPARPELGPRMIPWTLVAVLSGTLAMLMLINLAVLGGLDFSEGRPRL